MWKTALHLARKDVRLFFRDRTALMLALVLPIVLATVFGTAMKGMSGGGGSGGGIKALPLWVEDLDGTTESAALVERIRTTEGIRSKEGEGGHSQVRNGNYPMALVIEKGYADDLNGGRVPSLRLLQDPSKSLSIQVLTGRLLFPLGANLVDSIRGPLFANLMREVGFPEGSLDRVSQEFERSVERISEIGDEAGSVAEAPGGEAGSVGFDFFQTAPKLLGITTEDVMKSKGGQPKKAGVSHAFAAMAVMMLMFTLVAGAGTLLEERDQGTLLRLQVIPRAGDAILLGKLLHLVVIGALQLVVLFLFGKFVFGVPVFENLMPLTLISACTLFAVAAMGMVFATASHTRKQLEGASTLVILGMSALGGAWFPREMTPDIFQTLGNFTLTAWAMDAYHGVLWYGKGIFRHGELGGIWPQLSVLVAVGLVLLWIARRLYARRFGPAA